ncbi:hypothetical protein NQ315_013265 [Exocentrus adspersus]|uniref:RNase H type-1 domain-containing protein n=1 Tax=Exocentrus adspersus TaxID=1586481 RepID=A0AAV8VK72_9CUCU|nr:hypothetical protein NQ315_013265 [Exocentrus adspersus]
MGSSGSQMDPRHLRVLGPVSVACAHGWNLAALHALKSPRITSQVVLECTNSLTELGQRNKVRLVWVPGHNSVAGNEEADALARKGSSDIFTRPEPAARLSYSYPQGSIDNWTREKCQEDWSRGDRVAAGQAPN